MRAGRWDLWSEVNAFRKKKVNKEGEGEKKKPPTPPVLLVNVKFYSPILTDPLVMTLSGAFPGEKYPVCEKPQ